MRLIGLDYGNVHVGVALSDELGMTAYPLEVIKRKDSNKLRKTFADWYDHANDEQNENCVILAIHITKCKIFRDHGAVRYSLDFVNRAEFEEKIS